MITFLKGDMTNVKQNLADHINRYDKDLIMEEISLLQYYTYNLVFSELNSDALAPALTIQEGTYHT